MRRPSPTTLHNLGFLFVLLLIATLAWQGKRTQDTLLETNESVIGSFELITVTQGLLSSLQDVETGMRGYMLTGDPAFLAPYQVGRLDLVHRRQRLRSILLQRSPRWQAWLEPRRAELGKHERLRMGGSASAASTAAALDGTALPLALRAWLGDELQIRYGSDLHFHPDLPVAQQRAILAALSAAAARPRR